MRFKSTVVNGFQVFAVTGINTISFGIQATTAAKSGLLGFVVKRADPPGTPPKVMPGFKVFPSLIPNPTPHLQVSTWDHPVQSLVWDDFTCKPDHEYEYRFIPFRGSAANPDRTATPIKIRVKTEKLFSTGAHDIFFNRGVASSQAYERKFGNSKPDDLSPTKKAAALRWLRRDLDDAILKFIAQPKSGDGLLCCFYEFHYQPVVDALEAARQKGVDVKIVIDAKVNEFTDKDGHFHPSFPRVANLAAVQAAGLPDTSQPGTTVIRRQRNPDDIEHNKFMVWLKGSQKTPVEVWTGSTNISLGGITGQTNVGHWVRDANAALAFKNYWDLIAQDPGADAGDSTAITKQKKKAWRTAVEGLAAPPATIAAIPQGVTAVFSPRTGLKVLQLYVDLVDAAQKLGCITLAFGIGKAFKDQLKDNTSNSGLIFMLLEKKDKPTAKNKTSFVAINASNNVYKAWGSYIKDPVYQWAKETNAGILGLNHHVSYVHSKFLLSDPLGDDPIVVTGSANFSDASTNDNDENMIVIRGSRRAADIYFTEFNRLFNHYYFRAVTEDVHDAGKPPDASSLFLVEKPKDWLVKYTAGKLKAKRVQVYADMKGFTTLP